MVKKITFLAILLSSVAFAQNKKQRWSDTYVVKETPKIPIEEINAFIGENQYLVTYSAGDFNGDKLIDAVVVLGDKKEIEGNQNKQEGIKRPLLILKRNKQGTLELMHENDKIVYCYMCGSPNGSPLTSIVFKGNTFAVQHEAGKSNRWTRIVSFEYDREKEVWLLLKDATSQYNIISAKMNKSVVRTQDDFGFIVFENVDVFEEDLIKKKAN